ncbi:hypothetical protein EWM64_g8599 [Hericium alpestre]|uniref:BTB domain-containing protein n=1 Tax=Hericium alpestre TaxID=135208 RepID=A0A4Y9ZMC1_9AGAM|nr:hypothetical protein EWM64_g8599 [Hericium alpestre]
MEGESDDKPIDLPGTTVDEFEALLDFLYNRPYDDYSSFDLTRWKNLLTVSDRYQFDKVRQRAIAEITKIESDLNGVDQLLLAVKCNIIQWTVPALVKLLVRPKILELEEAERLPLPIVLRLWNAREVFRRTPVDAPMQLSAR